MIESPAPKAELRRAQADTWVYFDGELRRYGDAHLGLLTHALHCADLDAHFSPVAILALGSYGRSELAPFSDVDVMVLYG